MNNNPNLEENEVEENTQEEPKIAEQQIDEYKDMNKIDIPLYEKNKGTESFKEGNIFEAIKHYSKAIMAYQYLMKDGVINQEEDMQRLLIEIYLPSNLNLSLCYMKQKEYKLGLDFANKALEVDKNNIKALYRRGTCYLHLQEFANAAKDFKSILALDVGNEEALQAMTDLQQRREKQKQKEKIMSEKMLGSLDYPDQQQSKQNDENGQKLTFFGKIKKFLGNLCQRKQKIN